MNSLRNLLREADPFPADVARFDLERERMRQVILRESQGAVGTEVSEPARRTLVMAVAAVMVMAVVGYRLWLPVTPVFAAVRFEVRLAEDQPIPGLVVAHVARVGRLIYLHPEIVVSNDDVAQSWATETAPNRFGVSLDFTPSGSERLRQATASHVGRPVALLVDGVVIAAPVVRSPIAESAVITGDFARVEADRIVAGIGKR